MATTNPTSPESRLTAGQLSEVHRLIRCVSTLRCVVPGDIALTDQEGEDLGIVLTRTTDGRWVLAWRSS